MLRAFGAIVAALMLFAGAAQAAQPHRLALQISDTTPEKMSAVLNVAANVSKFYSDKGEEVEIQIIAFNAGLHMLREDTSQVKPRITSFAKSMPNVSFKACQNTIDGMPKREGKDIPIVAEAERVPSGAVRLIELSEGCWTILRP